MRAFRLAYDGRPYYGFQRQPDVSTVEGTLFDALASLGVTDEVDKPPGYAAAGRTDAGVSAVAQTVAFDAPDWCTPRALNSALPGSIRAWAAAEVSEGFHATLAAASREYTYHLHAPDADLARAKSAVGALSGEHDFHNLTSDETGTGRDVQGTVAREGEFVVCRLTADGFPREFVRRFVAVVEEIATGRSSLDRVEQVLAADPLSGPDGVSRAPPEPLVLTGVRYPGVSFSVDGDAAETVHEVFEEIRVDALTRSRVADSIRRGVESA